MGLKSHPVMSYSDLSHYIALLSGSSVMSITLLSHYIPFFQDRFVMGLTHLSHYIGSPSLMSDTVQAVAPAFAPCQGSSTPRNPRILRYLRDLGFHLSRHSLCRRNHPAALYCRFPPFDGRLHSFDLGPRQRHPAHRSPAPRQHRNRLFLLSRRPWFTSLGRARSPQWHSRAADRHRTHLRVYAVVHGGPHLETQRTARGGHPVRSGRRWRAGERSGSRRRHSRQHHRLDCHPGGSALLVHWHHLFAKVTSLWQSRYFSPLSLFSRERPCCSWLEHWQVRPKGFRLPVSP